MLGFYTERSRSELGIFRFIRIRKQFLQNTVNKKTYRGAFIAIIAVNKLEKGTNLNFFSGFTEDSVVAKLLNLQAYKHKEFSENEKPVA